MSQLVFEINEEYTVRPKNKKPGAKPADAHDACNVYDLIFISEELLEFYLQILGILNIYNI